MERKMPEKLFAVTDFNRVIPLKVVGVSKQDGFTVLTTEIDMEQPDDAENYLHSKYYKKLFVKEKELEFSVQAMHLISNSSCVFLELERAKEFAIKSLDEEIASKQRELENLRDRRVKVAAMGN